MVYLELKYENAKKTLIFQKNIGVEKGRAEQNYYIFIIKINF